MNLFSKQNANNNKSNLPMMVVAFILFAVGTAFGQTAVENTPDSSQTLTTTTATNSVAKQEEASASNNMNFVLWFMGTKQDPNAKILPAGTNTKKEFITSGTAPNRLLIKAFLKKAVNYENAIV